MSVLLNRSQMMSCRVQNKKVSVTEDEVKCFSFLFFARKDIFVAYHSIDGQKSELSEYLFYNIKSLNKFPRNLAKRSCCSISRHPMTSVRL